MAEKDGLSPFFFLMEMKVLGYIKETFEFFQNRDTYLKYSTCQQENFKTFSISIYLSIHTYIASL